MFSHDSLVEVTKPHYADDPVSTKDAFSNLTLMEALKALVIFCRDRLEQLTLDPVCDRFAQDLCALDAMGIARHFFSLREGPEWVGLFAGRLGAVTENQAPMYFGPANRAALDALIHLLRVIEEGNWPPGVGVFAELAELVGKVLLPNMAEPEKAAINDLLAIPCPMEKQGGRGAVIGDLERIAPLVESILDGKPIEAKEPLALVSDPKAKGKDPAKVMVPTVEEPNPKKGPGGRKKKLNEANFKTYAKKFPGKLALVTLKELSKYWGVAKSTIARHDYWKSIMGRRKVTREDALDRCDPKTNKGTTRAAKRDKDRQEEVEEERDRKLDRF